MKILICLFAILASTLSAKATEDPLLAQAMPFDRPLFGVPSEPNETTLDFLNRRLLRDYSHYFSGTTQNALRNAATVHRGLVAAGTPVRADYILVIDYTLAADQARLFSIGREFYNDRHHMVVRQYHVAHGGGPSPGFRTNNDLWMRTPSSRSGSGLSSYGAYLTAEFYVGGVGEAIRLNGLEPTQASGLGLRGNSSARERRIVLHADLIRLHPNNDQVPFLQHTRGCPAFSRLARDEIYSMVEASRTPTLLFAHWSESDLRANMAAAGAE